MNTLDETAETLEVLLGELDDEIDILTKRFENGGADDVRDEIGQLRARQVEARTRLEAMSAAFEKT